MIRCEDGTTIHSWLLYHPDHNSSKKLPTIIFFHGNAGNIGLRLPNAIQMYHYLKANIWLIEYRGYGDSDDVTPSEAGLKLDAEGLLNYVNNPQTRNLHSSVDPRRLFVFGRSLGGAVAFHMAQYSQSSAYPPLAGVIVENTFLSISKMVDHLMPIVAPLKMLILRIGWNSEKIAPSIRIPTLFLAGAKDTLVPPSHMLELYDRMTSSKVGTLTRMHVVPKGTHNETWMQGGKEYWTAIQRFIEEVFAVERQHVGPSSYAIGGNGINNNNGPFQRKANAALTSSTMSTSSSGECNDSVEVDIGYDAAEDAADMISSVGNIIGMAKEATRATVAGAGVKGVGAGAKSAYNKKD